MILYSKSGDFLGIGKDELSFLGFEDLDEFKSLHNDVADLFVNKPGYIFKFKNFSWIDYTLHSGAPKKSVILKLKNGNEVEAPIKIKELFLFNPKENDDIYYSVEFTNSITQNNSIHQEATFTHTTPNIAEQEPIEEESSLVSLSTYKEDAQEEFQINDPIEEESFEEDFTENVALNIAEPIEEEPQMKLKIDEDIFDNDGLEEEDEIPNKLLISEDEEEPFESKLKIDDEVLSPKEEESINFVEDYTPAVETIESNSTNNMNFDLAECAEGLDLDISLIAQLVMEYVEKIDTTIPKIYKNIEETDIDSLKTNIYKLKGISDNLHITQISNSLIEILEAKDSEMQKNRLNNFEKIVTQFKGELI